MEIKDLLKSKVKKIQDITNLNLLRYELFAIFATTILSKEEFKSNKDITNFLDIFGITFKEYVMKTRTLIMAKTLRIIEKLEMNDLNIYKEDLKRLYLIESDDDHTKNNATSQEKNYMKDILNKYSRNKN